MNLRLLCAMIVIAVGQPAHGDYLYLLRGDATTQGIYKLEIDGSGRRTPFAEFVFAGGIGGPFGGENLRLTTSNGLLHLHGPNNYEFDAETGQLLRRFQALNSQHDAWGFHGVAVDPAVASVLGVEPGYYGNVHCVAGHQSACRQASETFPGYPHPATRPLPQVLLRRGWQPHDTRLHLVAQFEPVAARGARFPALDIENKRFLFMFESPLDGGGSLQTLSSWSPTGAGESPLRQIMNPPQSDGGRIIRGMTVASGPGISNIYLNTLAEHASVIVERSIGGDETTVLEDAYGAIADLSAPTRTPVPLYEQIFPVVGEAPGAHGTYWRSDAWFFNPSSSPMQVRLRLLSNSQASTTLTLLPGESRELLNILRVLRGAGNAEAVTDAVVIESDATSGAQLSAYSRTYTSDLTGGTYGQLVPAVPLRAGYSNHLPLPRGGVLSETLSILPMDKRNPHQFRHNFGAANTTDQPVIFTLGYATLDDEAPPSERKATVTIPAHSVRQFTIESLFPEDVMTRYPPYVSVSGSAPVPTWMSIVDNISGDASFIPFTLFGIESMAGATLAIPAIIRSPGAHGTSWKTDAYGVFEFFVTDGSAQRPFVVYRGMNACASERTTLTPQIGFATSLEWPNFWRTVFPDLIAQVCGPDKVASGALEVETGSWMSMVSRTYTSREDGGTYGDILPLYPPRGWPARHFAGLRLSEQFRVNVGLYNGTSRSATHRLQLFRQDGSIAGTRDVVLAPFESLQAPLGELIHVPHGLYGLSVTSDAGVWPWVSIVDNRTGDPTNLW